MSGCQIQNCQQPHYAKGLCEMHYARMRKHGDPLKTNVPRRVFEPEKFVDCGQDCTEWDGTEYPRKRLGGKSVTLTRIILETKLGRKLKPKHGALHTCDNPKCVNGNHLYEGTQKDNAQDRDARGRTAHPKGWKPPWTKLDELTVKKIKQLLELGIPYRRVAIRFSISASSVHHIKKGRSWNTLKFIP